MFKTERSPLLTQMKLSAFVATAAVIGGSFLIPNPAEAGNLGSMPQCIDDAANVIESKTNTNRANPSVRKKAQIICHYRVTSTGSETSKLNQGITKAGYQGIISAKDFHRSYVYINYKKAYVFGNPPTQAQRSASRPQTEYEAMMERVNSGAPTPNRSTSSPAPRSISRPTNTASSRCPAGTSYHKIRVGGLIKRTAAEGCYSNFQASQLRMQANANQQQRIRNFQQNLNESFSSPTNCSGTINSWGNSGYATYNTTCY